MPDQRFAEDLDELRLRAGLSLRELVRASGVPRSTLSDALAGRRSPRLETVLSIVAACGADPEPWRDRFVAETERPARAAPDPAPARARSGAPAELPRDTALVGRGPELMQLGDGGAWIVHGSPGVGKTALAVHWAHRVARLFPDGQLFVNLRGHHPTLEPVSGTEALQRLLRSLGGRSEGTEVDDLARAWRTTLSGRRVLIVLDDAVDVEQIRPLLPGDPGCALIATSRHHLMDLVVHDGVAGVALDVLSPNSARQVLEQTMGLRRHDDPDAIERIAGHCAHLPLALRLAGAVLALEPGRALSGFADEFDAGGRLSALERPITPSAVEVAFELSYRALTGPAQLTFRRLGLDPGPDLGVDSAARLVDVSRESVTRALSTLVEAHLVEPAGPGRFRMHDLVREYAARLAASIDDAASRDAARTRLLEWYTDRAAAVSDTLSPGSPRFWVDEQFRSAWHPGDEEATAWLDAEQRAVVAAVEDDARNGSGEHAWRLVDLLGAVLLRRMDVTDLLLAADAGAAAALRRDNARAHATMLLNRAWLHWRVHDAESAVRDFTDALGAFRASGRLPGQAAALLGLAAPSALAGDPQTARSQAAAALELYRSLGDEHGQATALNALANIAMHLADFRTAVANFEESVQLLRGGRSRGNIAIGLGNLALACVQVGRAEDGFAHAEEAVRVAREVGDRYAETLALVNGSIALEQSAHLERARTWATDALEAAQAVAIPAFEACALDALATATRRLGRPGVEELRARALRVCRETGNRSTEAEVLIGAAEDRQFLGAATQVRAGADAGSAHFHAAAALATQALAAARDAGDLHSQGLARTSLAASALALGRHNEAVTEATTAAQLHQASGAQPAEARARRVLGSALHRDGDTVRARIEWARALELLDACRSPEGDALRAMLAGDVQVDPASTVRGTTG